MSDARRVLLVGATGHLGRALAFALAARGDHLVLTARDPARLQSLAADLTAPSSSTHPSPSAPPPQVIPADLRAPDAPARIATAALATGDIDHLLLASGPFPRTPLADLDRDALLDALTVHAVAPLLLASALSPALARRHGAIVALGDAGVARPYPNHLAYITAKGALDAGLRTLALELAPHVRVNLLSLGVVTDPEASRDPARFPRLAARATLGRFGTPAEVVHAALALLDATWTTGEVWGLGR
ncbi:SDR family oxidoreductase [Chondromyces apiculatus]|uniref:Short-chain dehydrogenase/reductase SDR n=1 Tax=Chondromyces apiculatus DSM 436 TaxID=1192034 RepID=A0A017TFV6_9BACT|nr:SDR family oxidoreductase [Chondromyces apiculatus]EYF07812.1 short-chain dehydrogenase/reductase SDR [Chondromyces apiculatus DSM 436]